MKVAGATNLLCPGRKVKCLIILSSHGDHVSSVTWCQAQTFALHPQPELGSLTSSGLLTTILQSFKYYYREKFSIELSQYNELIVWLEWSTPEHNGTVANILCCPKIRLGPNKNSEALKQSSKS